MRSPTTATCLSDSREEDHDSLHEKKNLLNTKTHSAEKIKKEDDVHSVSNRQITCNSRTFKNMGLNVFKYGFVFKYGLTFLRIGLNVPINVQKCTPSLELMFKKRAFM